MNQTTTPWWSWWPRCPVSSRLSTSSYSGGSTQWSCCHTADCGGCCGSSRQFLWQQSLCLLPALLPFFGLDARAWFQESYFDSFDFWVSASSTLTHSTLPVRILCSTFFNIICFDSFNLPVRFLFKFSSTSGCEFLTSALITLVLGCLQVSLIYTILNCITYKIS